jgi:energy-coupling factor transporter transmembrane protein EcfT
MPSESGARWILAVQLSLFVVTGISLLAISVSDLHRLKDADSMLLFFWIFGTFVFAGFINWSTNGRSILPTVPAMGVLLMRRIEQGEAAKIEKKSLRRVLIPLVPAALISLAVTWGDYKLANSARTIAKEIYDRYENHPGKIWFQGHWGFQYYMEQHGAKAIEVKRWSVTPGDITVVPTNNTNLFRVPAEYAELRETIEAPSPVWLSTMHPSVGAGFFADEWGPLPFAAGSERYNVFLMKEKPTAGR